MTQEDILKRISVRDIFAHTNVEIILTDEIGKNNTESKILFENLKAKIEKDALSE